VAAIHSNILLLAGLVGSNCTNIIYCTLSCTKLICAKEKEQLENIQGI